MEVRRVDKDLRSLRELLQKKENEAHVEILLFRVNQSEHDKFTAVEYDGDHVRLCGNYTKAEINNLGFDKLSQISDFIVQKDD